MQRRCQRTWKACLVYGGGLPALGKHEVPQGLQHLKGHIQQVLVEEVHQLLADAVGAL